MKCAVLTIAALCAAVLPMTPAHADPGSACAAPNASERADIQNLFAAYGPYFDYHQAESWASLFTDDGIFSFPGSGSERTVVTGHAALVGFANQSAVPGQVFAHFPGQTLMIKQGADKIRAFTPVGVVQVNTTEQFAGQFQALGSYDDVLVRTSKGWRFKSRTANIYGAGALPAEFVNCRP